MITPADFGKGCPPPHRLNQLASNGGGDPALEAHLRECGACRAAMDQIRADDEFLRNFTTRGMGAPHPPGESPTHFRLPGYEIAREISQGRQGIVYKAIQRSTRKTVAIKVMRTVLLGDSIDRLRFEREVKILAKLDHPHIVTILDSGFSDGVAYFVMEYVGGRTLAELIAERGKTGAAGGASAGTSSTLGNTRTQNPHQALRADLNLFAKICEAIDAAHLRGIIHRDIKPGNIRIDERGEPRVLDFGLAKLIIDPVDAAATMMSNVIIGTPAYASPEQLGGHTDTLDIRTDVYSLGVVLYELLTGTLPFESKGTIFEIAQRVRNTEPTAPRLRRRDIDEDLSTILLRCLQKDPERRYRNAGDLARDVRRYLAGEAIDARRDSTWYVIRKSVSRHLGRILGFAAVAAVLWILGTVGLLGWQRSELLKQQLAAEKLLREEVTRDRNDTKEIANVLFGANMTAFRDLYMAEDIRDRMGATMAVLFEKNLIRVFDKMSERTTTEQEIALRITAANWYAATHQPQYILKALDQVKLAIAAADRLPSPELRKGMEPIFHSTRANICRDSRPQDMDCWLSEYQQAVETTISIRGIDNPQTMQFLLSMSREAWMRKNPSAFDWWLSRSAESLGKAKIRWDATPVSARPSQFRDLLAAHCALSETRESELRESGNAAIADRLAEQRAVFAAASQPVNAP